MCGCTECRHIVLPWAGILFGIEMKERKISFLVDVHCLTAGYTEGRRLARARSITAKYVFKRIDRRPSEPERRFKTAAPGAAR